MTLKTLKTFLEVRRPKSADERKFMDKHVVIKHADRNGNGDDLFNAKNIKTIKREKEGHGYDTGKDAKVYEAKLDEVETIKRDEYGNVISREGAADRRVIRLTKGWGDKGKSMKANKGKLGGIKEHTQRDVLEWLDSIGVEITDIELEKLQEEVLDELSNQTLKSYIKKAGRSASISDDSAEHSMELSKKWTKPELKDKALNRAAVHATKSVKRTNNIIKAAKKIKEETQLDEISQKLARAYRDKAGEEKEIAVDDRSYYKAHKDNVDHEDNVIRKRGKGIDTATKKIRGYAKVNVKESNEELDDLFSLTIEDLSDKNQALLKTLYESLELENQISLVETLQEDDGLDSILDFALESELNELSKNTVRSYYNKAGEEGKMAQSKYALGGGDWTKDGSLTRTLKKRLAGRKMALKRRSGQIKMSEETLNESPIAGTKKISSHEGKDGHTHEIRYDKDNEEYSVHHYKDNKHLGEGPVSYHSDKQEAKDQVAYDVKNFKR